MLHLCTQGKDHIMFSFVILHVISLIYSSLSFAPAFFTSFLYFQNANKNLTTMRALSDC